MITMATTVAVLLMVVAGPVGEPSQGRFTARPPGNPTAEVVATRLPGEAPRRFEIRLTPRDHSGLKLGSGRGEAVELEVPEERLVGDLEDAGDGVYRQVLELSAETPPADIELGVAVLGFPCVVTLHQALRRNEATLDPRLAEAVSGARADLAERLGIEEDAIAVVDVGRVTWRDGSIGCPRPGLASTQALVPGIRVRLGAGGWTYSYHGARERPPALCETPEEPLPEPAR